MVWRWAGAAVVACLWLALAARGAAAATPDETRAEALRRYGWKAEAVAYVAARTRIAFGLRGFGGAGTVYNPATRTLTVAGDPAAPEAAYEDIALEYMHVMDEARGFRTGQIGVVLYD